MSFRPSVRSAGHGDGDALEHALAFPRSAVAHIARLCAMRNIIPLSWKTVKIPLLLIVQ
jgi:hypothetical protein